MLLFKRLLTSCVLFLLVSLALLTVVGVVVGARGGVDYDSSYTAGHAAGYEVTRRYGPVVFLSTLSVSALSALIISFSGILPWCRKQPPSSPSAKV